MTDVGVMGLGKLGLIFAMTLDVHGKHHVTGCDISTRPTDILAGRVDPPREAGIVGLLKDNKVNVVNDPETLVANADVIFVAVQTPHAAIYDGTGPVPETTADFEYGYLINAVRQLSRASDHQAKPITIAVISTVLPGTCDRLLRPLLTDQVTLVYTPSLISLGQVADDLLNPEFVILGSDSYDAAYDVMKIYSTLHTRPVQLMSLVSAELTKVAYNTFTSMKIVFANTVLEIAEKTGAEADAVTGTLSLATDNLMSPKYMRGSVGGGGYCHPRDVIAMSHLAKKLDLSADLFGFLARAREAQSSWLASLAVDYYNLTGHPVTVLGLSYKPESELSGGSSALLLYRQLADAGVPVRAVDPYATSTPVDLAQIAQGPAVFVIGCGHTVFRSLEFGHGSVVIDPFGMIPDQPGVTVVRLGRNL